MLSEYDIFFHNTVVGKATIGLDGLYCCISCSCKLDYRQIYRLELCINNNKHKLGILVPDKDMFVLEKRIPIRLVKEGTLSFNVVTQKEEGQLLFCPVKDDLPFPHVERLEQCVMKIKNGDIGVAFLNEFNF